MGAALIDIIKPKRPVGPGWRQCPPPPAWVTLGYAGERWEHAENRLHVISAVEVADDGDGIEKGPEYHISVSTWNAAGATQRCSSADALWMLAAFDLLDGKEDNHVPGGLVRNFWRPVADQLIGLECKCQDIEPAIVEDKGDYIWRGVTK